MNSSKIYSAVEWNTLLTRIEASAKEKMAQKHLNKVGAKNNNIKTYCCFPSIAQACGETKATQKFQTRPTPSAMKARLFATAIAGARMTRNIRAMRPNSMRYAYAC